MQTVLSVHWIMIFQINVTLTRFMVLLSTWIWVAVLFIILEFPPLCSEQCQCFRGHYSDVQIVNESFCWVGTFNESFESVYITVRAVTSVTVDVTNKCNMRTASLCGRFINPYETNKRWQQNFWCSTRYGNCEKIKHIKNLSWGSVTWQYKGILYESPLH